MEPHIGFDYDEVDRRLGWHEAAPARSAGRELAEEAIQLSARMLFFAIEKASDPAWQWGIMFAISHPDCGGRSIADVANELGLSRALLSARAREFCRHFRLPPSSYMRTAAAVEHSRQARNRTINGLKHHRTKHGAS